MRPQLCTHPVDVYLLEARVSVRVRLRLRAGFTIRVGVRVGFGEDSRCFR